MCIPQEKRDENKINDNRSTRRRKEKIVGFVCFFTVTDITYTTSVSVHKMMSQALGKNTQVNKETGKKTTKEWAERVKEWISIQRNFIRKCWTMNTGTDYIYLIFFSSLFSHSLFRSLSLSCSAYVYRSTFTSHCASGMLFLSMCIVYLRLNIGKRVSLTATFSSPASTLILSTPPSPFVPACSLSHLTWFVDKFRVFLIGVAIRFPRVIFSMLFVRCSSWSVAKECKRHKHFSHENEILIRLWKGFSHRCFLFMFSPSIPMLTDPN